MTNAELRSSKKRYDDKLKTIEKRLEALQTRLGKLYDALETGRLGLDDLAPRIKQLKGEIDSLEVTRSDIAQRMRDAKPALLDGQTISAYVKDLKDILGKGMIIRSPSTPEVEIHPREKFYLWCKAGPRAERSSQLLDD